MSSTLNCPRCGRLFKKVLAPVCISCEKLEEEQFKELRDFLEEYPLATITECSDATGIPTKRILRYIREGRLIVPEGMADEIRCTQCGQQITEGSFCEACTAKMTKDLSEAFIDKVAPTPEEKKSPDKPSKKINKRGVGFHTRKPQG